MTEILKFLVDRLKDIVVLLNSFKFDFFVGEISLLTFLISAFAIVFVFKLIKFWLEIPSSDLPTSSSKRPGDKTIYNFNYNLRQYFNGTLKTKERSSYSESDVKKDK